MATTDEKKGKMWECKQCRHPVSAEETMAYHLVNGVLYGWCAGCFTQRAKPDQSLAEKAA
ncbi:MAG TPA: hypothetical protein VNO70_02235 [Blastocatellia bacterium]|nr:hypothetical protein [Blastocatellia bacterium]